jgi:hypothetical protein
MGFFKDVHDRNRRGRESQATRAVAADGVAGVATVVSAVPAGPVVDLDPTVQLQLLVAAGPFPPHLATVSTVVPRIHLARTRPGTVLPVDVSRRDPRHVLVAWNRAV